MDTKSNPELVRGAVRAGDGPSAGDRVAELAAEVEDGNPRPTRPRPEAAPGAREARELPAAAPEIVDLAWELYAVCQDRPGESELSREIGRRGRRLALEILAKYGAG